jgi:hypothetical protein
MEYRNDRTFGVTAGRAAAGAALVAVFGVAWLGGTYSAGERLGNPEVQVERSYLAQALSGNHTAGDFVLAGKDWDMSNLDHYRVDHWIAHFTGPKRDDFRRFLERSGRYGPMIQQELAARDMPQDLIYLAMIESGMNPEAYSHAHAAGLWQFIAETGSRYGLTVNSVVDERYDPVKATQAGLDYLTYLHNRFGSWYLAAAGYNTGENRVGRIMREVTGSEKGTDEDFYRIWDRLPRETRDYVPLMVAAARIAKDPAKYGFEDVQFQPALAFDEVEASRERTWRRWRRRWASSSPSSGGTTRTCATSGSRRTGRTWCGSPRGWGRASRRASRRSRRRRPSRWRRFSTTGCVAVTTWARSRSDTAPAWPRSGRRTTSAVIASSRVRT